MNPLHGRRGRFALVAVAALGLAGCSGSQAPFAPSGPGATPLARHPVPLEGASTEVDIQNDWTASIAGSGSEDCWTISPALPIVGSGDTAGPIKLTYRPSTSCGVPSGIGISYGPAAVTGERCTFTVVYDVNFSFSVAQSSNTACSIKYPPNGVSAILVYAQNASGSSRVERTH